MTRRSIMGRIALAVALLALAILAPQVTSRFYQADETGRLLYGIILPSLPFAVLCLLALATTQGRFVFRGAAISGAMLGAVLAIAFPWTWIWFDSAHYHGGGANIGLGILLLCLPCYLPLAMVAGGWLGRACGSLFEK